jgi:S-adenosylmethionine:tRNA ribosyltransferase-isomerase
MTVLADFVLPPGSEAREPPEARGVPRDGVRMLVSRRRTGEITHHAFAGLPGLLLPGDLLVVNNSGTLPAAVPCVAGQRGLSVHFSTPLPDGRESYWRNATPERRPRQGSWPRRAGCTQPGRPGQCPWRPGSASTGRC